MYPTVCLVMKNTAPLGCDPQQLVRSLQQYVDAHLGVVWGVGAGLRIGVPLPGEWSIYFLDDADVAGALGYHDDDAGPQGFVFVKTAAQDGESVSVVASHELAELLIDPAANLAALSPRGHWVAYEVSDPVQGCTFDCGGLPVSDFVFPAWFGEPGDVYDREGLLDRPWQVARGGYALIESETGDWTMLHGSLAAADAFYRKDKRLRRVTRRRRRGPQEMVQEGSRPARSSSACDVVLA